MSVTERMIHGGVAYQPHSRSSRDAADAIEPKLGTYRRVVLDYLRNNGASTDEQIAAGTGLKESTARPRRVELLQRGFIEPAGWGQTSSNRKAQLWNVVPRGPSQGLLSIDSGCP